MAGPTIAYVNLLSTGTILESSTGTGSKEIEYPYSNVFHRLLSIPYRSNYRTFVIDANNNKLDFSITSGGGSALVSTIVSGAYRGAELAAEIASTMNTTAGTTDIYCTYDEALSAFTIGKISGFLYLKWATGTNKNNSIGATLQFLTFLDITVASGSGGSSRGELAAKTSSGTYIITTSNNKLYYNDGTARTATIPTGTYNAKGLAAEIKYQMDTTSTVTNFHVNHYPNLYTPLNAWVIMRQSGTIQLTCTNTTNAIWDTIGFSTASDKTGQTLYAGNYSRIHGPAGEGIVVDLGSAQLLKFVAIAGANYDAAGTGGTATLTIQANSTDAWTSPTFSNNSPTALQRDRLNHKSWAYWDLGSGQTFRYWRILVANNDNADGYVQIGAFFGAVQYTLAFNYGRHPESSAFDLTERQLTDQAAIYGESKANQFQFSMNFQKIIQADKVFLNSFFDAVQNIKPFVILLDSTGNTAPKFMWATSVERPTIKERAPAVGGAVYSIDSWTIREGA